jgi:hypothetical protein
VFADLLTVDVAVSPNGRYVAAVARHAEVDRPIIIDLQSGTNKQILRVGKDDLGGRTDAYISEVFWKNEDRLLFRTQIRADDGRRSISYRTLGRLGDRLLAINRDGTQLAGVLNDSRSSALAGAFNLGEIASFLPKDPEHVLMYISGWNGRSLF